MSKFDRPKVQAVNSAEDKKKRKRIVKKKVDPRQFNKSKSPKSKVVEISPEEAQKRVRETLAKLQGGGRKSSVRNRKDKRNAHKAVLDQELEEQVQSNKVIKVTEFATANELASLMNIGVTEIITSCMSLGIMISMNQRLDAETIEMYLTYDEWKAFDPELPIKSEATEKDLIDMPILLQLWDMLIMVRRL